MAFSGTKQKQHTLHFVSKCFSARKHTNFERAVIVSIYSHNQGTVAALPPTEDAAPEAQSNVLGVIELNSIFTHHFGTNNALSKMHDL